MKQYMMRTMLVLVVMGILFSCKKDNEKKFIDSIAGKTWWGKFAYTGKVSQYYSIQFDANGSFTWSELTADYTGKWLVKGKHLTFTFDGTNKQIKADIAGDRKLFNIENNSTYGWAIESGQLIANPNMSSLDNTFWKGAYITIPGPVTVIGNLRFLPDLKLQVEFPGSNTKEGPFSYTRSASGVAIRVQKNLFGIILSETEMKGTDHNNIFEWSVIKQ
jgi:hypothetical protein